MKVVHIYGNIINCEEIRNVEIHGFYVLINYKNPTSPADTTLIKCASHEDAKDVMDIIYEAITH